MNWKIIFALLLALLIPVQDVRAQGTTAYNPVMRYQGTYNGSTNYNNMDVVVSAGVTYVSLVGTNSGHTPASSPSQWAPITAAGGVVSFNTRTGAVVLSASDVQAAVSALTSCASAGFAYVPQSNTCVAFADLNLSNVNANAGRTNLGVAQAPVIPQTNLIAFYDTYNGSGSTLKDASGHGYDAPLCTGAYGTSPTYVASGYGLQFNPALQTDCVGPLPTALTAVRSLVMSVYITPMGTAVSPGVNNGVGLGAIFTYNVLPFNGYTYSGTVGIVATSTTSNATQMYTPNSFSLSKPPESPYAGYQIIGIDLGHWNGTSCDTNDVYYINGVAIPGTYVLNGCSGALAGTVGGITGNFFIGPAPAGPQGSGSGSTPWQATGYRFPGTLYSMAAYSAPLGASGQAIAAAALAAKNNAGSAITVPQPTNLTAPINMAIGDSITCGFPSLTPYAQLLTLNSTPFTGAVINCISGITTAADIASEAYRSAPNCATPSGSSYASILTGTNDFLFFPGDTGQTVYNKNAQLASILRRKGCRVFVGSMLSRTNTNLPSATACGNVFDTCKDALNPLLAGGVAAGAFDGFVDFASFPGLGADNAFSNPSNVCQTGSSNQPVVGGSSACFQADGVHPTQAGQQTMANIYSNVYNRIFGFTKLSPTTTSASTYQMLPSNGGLTLTGSAAQAITLPDCTGMTGLDFFISNSTAFTSTVVGLVTAQPINGSTSAVSIAAGKSIDLFVQANSYTTSGCHWTY